MKTRTKCKFRPCKKRNGKRLISFCFECHVKTQVSHLAVYLHWTELKGEKPFLTLDYTLKAHKYSNYVSSSICVFTKQHALPWE